MRFISNYLTLFIILTCWLHLEAQSWDFVKEKDGIRMFTRPGEQTSFKCFRGETVFHCSMEEVGQYIGVANNFDQWDEKIRELTVLNAIPGRHVECYFVYLTPWPLVDRDFYVEVDVSYDSVMQTKTVYAYPMEKDFPDKDGRIRIRSFWLRWTLTMKDDRTIDGVLEGYIDPGGLVPSWLYNLVIVEAPYKVMKGIKERVERGDGS